MTLWDILMAQKLGWSDDLFAQLAAEKLNGGRMHTLSGIPPLTFTPGGRPLTEWIIIGNALQNGTPSPDNPVPVRGVGDLVPDGEHAGQYVIPITVSGSGQSVTTCIYLTSPLMTGEVLRSTGERDVKWGKHTVSITSTVVSSVGNHVLGVSSDSSMSAKSRAFLYCDRAVSGSSSLVGSCYANTSNICFVGSASDTLDTLKNAYNGATVHYQLLTPTAQAVTVSAIQTVLSTSATLTVGTQVQPAGMEIRYR